MPSAVAVPGSVAGGVASGSLGSAEELDSEDYSSVPVQRQALVCISFPILEAVCGGLRSLCSTTPVEFVAVRTFLVAAVGAA